MRAKRLWVALAGVAVLAVGVVVVAVQSDDTPLAGSAVPELVSQDAVVENPQVVVSLGDSYIAGTAGRWRANTNGWARVSKGRESVDRADTGADAYDNYGVSFPGDRCYRSRSAEIHIGGGWDGINVACSGARTYSLEPNDEGDYKPGLVADGQLGYLTDIATENRVAMVVVSIGGNDFGFADILTTCATNFLTSLSLFPKLCSKDSGVLAQVSDDASDRVADTVAQALSDVVTTMRDAGYDDDEWTLISQNYPSPLPPASQVRYSQSGFDRQLKGGCPFYDADFDWFDTTLTPLVNRTVARGVEIASERSGKEIITLDLSGVFTGRRLCEKGTRLVEETSDDAELVEYAERIHQLHLGGYLDSGSPFDVRESVHPNSLGQLTLRSCLRQAFNDGDARSGVCSPPADWGSLDEYGEPTATFVPA